MNTLTLCLSPKPEVYLSEAHKRKISRTKKKRFKQKMTPWNKGISVVIHKPIRNKTCGVRHNRNKHPGLLPVVFHGFNTAS